jgi:hypothetical protein
MTYLINPAYQSPNHSPRNVPIKMIVLHATVGDLWPSINWLCNPASRVSTHYVISRVGHIYQLVDDNRVAWHAGVAAWNGETDINGISLGIELENANTGTDPYPAAQYDALMWLTRQKVAQYRITQAWVTRHLDVAQPIGRKSDPAGFAWSRFVTELFPPPDPFDLWGGIGKPTGDQVNWLVPQTWLRNKAALGRCLRAEDYPVPDVGFSYAVFERGVITYLARKNAAQVLLF